MEKKRFVETEKKVKKESRLQKERDPSSPWAWVLTFGVEWLLSMELMGIYSTEPGFRFGPLRAVDVRVGALLFVLEKK